MKAAVFHGANQPLTIEEVAVDKPMGREVLEPLLQGMLDHSHSAWFREGAHHVLVIVGKDDLRELVGPLLRALEGIEPEIAALAPTHHLLKALRGALS